MKRGRKPLRRATIRQHMHRLKHLAKHIKDFNNTKAIEDFIATKKSAHYKNLLGSSYFWYCKHQRIAWQPQIFSEDEHQPKLPTTEQVNKLITGAGKILSLKLRLSMETGLRPVELMELCVKDVDTVTKLVYPNTHKRGSARVLKISENLANALQKYIIKRDLDNNQRLFKGNADPTKGAKKYGDNYREMRKSLSKKLNDPTLLTVRLYDLRHYFLTYDYIKNRDIITTAEDGGHKDFNTTRKYIHLARVLELMENSEEYMVKTATNTDQAKELLEIGYTYVLTTPDGIMIFKKHK